MALTRYEPSSATPQRQLVDSLGYIDADFDDPAMQERVLVLVEQEMLSGRVKPRELKALPELKLSPFVQAELERVQRGEETPKVENEPARA
eukprot:7880801-Prorocentrum_lima.AAC.1